MKRFLIVLGLMGLMTAIAYVQLDRPPLGVDDAHIFFVYGRNLAEGQGIVYNAGGERVEGYTSTLWMLIVAAAYALFAQPAPWLLLISLLLAAAAVTAAWRFVDGNGRFTGRGWLLLAWVFSSPNFIIWNSLSLMDSALWTMVLTLSAVTVLTRPQSRWAAVFIILLLLTRPEGMLWGLLLITLAGLILTARQGFGAARRPVASLLAVYLAALAGLTGWRLLYFGYPLPNTYYAKVSPDLAYNLWAGLLYLMGLLYEKPYLIVTSLGAAMIGVLLHLPRLLIALRSGKPVTEARLRLVGTAVIALSALLLPVLTGGDHFNLFRFYQSSWPLLFLPVAALLDTLTLAIKRPLRYGLTAAFVAVLWLLPQTNWINPGYGRLIRNEFAYAAEGTRLGTTLNNLFPDGERPSVGVIIAGGIALTYEGKINDAMGLNNLAMAHTPGDRHGVKNHAAFNAAVFLSQPPDLFLPAASHWELAPADLDAVYAWQNDVLGGLLRQPQFTEQYQLVLLSAADAHILTFARRQFLAQLAPPAAQLQPCYLDVSPAALQCWRVENDSPPAPVRD